MNHPNLILGCGYLGLRVAKAWLAAGTLVAAVTRSRSDELRQAGVTPIPGDVLDPASLSFPPIRTVLYAIGLDRRAGRSMREVYVDGLRNVLTALGPVDRFIYISSTSAFGQTDGSWVDETSPTEPLEESGRVVLEAERTLREFRPDAIIMRFAGIYGPNRILRRDSLLRGEPVLGDADRFLNLIHVDDGVRAVLAAEAKGQPGETYLIADDEPPTRRAFFSATAEMLNAPVPTFLPAASAEPEANRRIRNAKAKRELGFAPRYPSFREGLAACLG